MCREGGVSICFSYLDDDLLDLEEFEYFFDDFLDDFFNILEYEPSSDSFAAEEMEASYDDCFRSMEDDADVWFVIVRRANVETMNLALIFLVTIMISFFVVVYLFWYFFMRGFWLLYWCLSWCLIWFCFCFLLSF